MPPFHWQAGAAPRRGSPATRMVRGCCGRVWWGHRSLDHPVPQQRWPHLRCLWAGLGSWALLACGMAEKSNSRPISRKQSVATFLQTIVISINIQCIRDLLLEQEQITFFSWLFGTRLWNGRRISCNFTLPLAIPWFFQCALKIGVFKP